MNERMKAQLNGGNGDGSDGSDGRQVVVAERKVRITAVVVVAGYAQLLDSRLLIVVYTLVALDVHNNRALCAIAIVGPFDVCSATNAETGFVLEDFEMTARVAKDTCHKQLLCR
jgi:5-formaminoimidazole-4-carboxamide-1-beta-D-ribofuranosyl 5'-monophosphate synthetase